METNLPDRTPWTHTLIYIIAWIVSIGLLVADLFLIRGIVMDIMTAIGLLRAAADVVAWRYARITYGWIVDAVNYVGLLIIGCSGIALVIAIEHYFRKGIPEGLLYKRVKRVIGTEVIVAAVTWIISMALGWLMIQFSA